MMAHGLSSDVINLDTFIVQISHKMASSSSVVLWRCTAIITVLFSCLGNGGVGAFKAEDILSSLQLFPGESHSLLSHSSSSHLRDQALTSTNAFTWAKASGGVNDMAHTKGLRASPEGEGTITWAANLTARVKYLAVDNSSNIYITGYFAEETIQIGGFTLENQGSASTDIFVAKLSFVGEVLWAQAIGSSENEILYGLALDSAGSVYLAAASKSLTITIGSSTLDGTSSGSFIAKLDAIDGSYLWAQVIEAIPIRLSVDPLGGVHTAGVFSSPTITIGSVTLENHYHTSNNDTIGSDCFAAVLDIADGGVIWANVIGGPGNESVVAVAAGPDGSMVITGASTSPILSYSSYSVYPIGDYDKGFYLLKINRMGSFQWATSYEGANTIINGMVVDDSGLVYVGGRSYNSFVKFDTISTFLIQPGLSFVAKFGGFADPVYLRPFPRTFIFSMAVDPSGNVFVGGNFYRMGENQTVASIDAFIGELDAGGFPKAAIAIGGNEMESIRALALDQKSPGTMVFAGYSASTIGEELETHHLYGPFIAKAVRRWAQSIALLVINLL